MKLWNQDDIKNVIEDKNKKPHFLVGVFLFYLIFINEIKVQKKTMKRIVRLTERDLTRLVKKVINESSEKQIIKYGYGASPNKPIIQAKDEKNQNSFLELYSDNTFSLVIDQYVISRILSMPILVGMALEDLTGDGILWKDDVYGFIDGINKGIYKLELGRYQKLTDREFEIKEPIKIIKTSSKNGGDGMSEIKSKVDEIIDRLRNLDFSNERNIEIIEDLYRFIKLKL